MVIVEINSGLGNQMFQYAAGLALAEKLNTDLLLDISWYAKSNQAQTPRNFELSIYPIVNNYADELAVSELIRPSSEGLLNKLKHRINLSKPIHKKWAFVEPHFHFYPKFFDANKTVYLSGYWQSEKYFTRISEPIRKLYSLDIQKNEPSFSILEQIIASPNSVAIHVRRGDMVKNPQVAQVHGSCNLDYYARSMKHLESLIAKPEYFIFSDEPQWCQDNIRSSFPVHIVSGNEGAKSYLDIQLMRHCKHNIIANSSFSWWGAWLNANPNKLVFAPLNWFNGDKNDTKDLIPSSWMRL
jgi:hypothetical protein